MSCRKKAKEEQKKTQEKVPETSFNIQTPEQNPKDKFKNQNNNNNSKQGKIRSRSGDNTHTTTVVMKDRSRSLSESRQTNPLKQLKKASTKEQKPFSQTEQTKQSGASNKTTRGTNKEVHMTCNRSASNESVKSEGKPEALIRSQQSSSNAQYNKTASGNSISVVAEQLTVRSSKLKKSLSDSYREKTRAHGEVNRQMYQSSEKRDGTVKRYKLHFIPTQFGTGNVCQY